MPDETYNVPASRALADAALRPYLDESEPETAVVDLLADIMHWCREHDVDYYACEGSAAMHYEAERPSE